MPTLHDELIQQPQALRDLVSYYQTDPDRLNMPGGEHQLLVFSGMGASYHAGWIGAFYFNSLGIPALAIEASDLANYAAALRTKSATLIYISQSGSSGEITPLLQHLGDQSELLGITNTSDSLLTKKSKRVYHQVAGDEQLIASKTYINSVALLWLMARKAAGLDMSESFEQVINASHQAEHIIASASENSERLISFYQAGDPLLFTGHGPHAVTARQASMASSEWAKIVSLYSGVGAFRHGFIETVRPGFGVIVFSTPGKTQESSLTLASDLSEMGARVLRIEQGRILEPGQPSTSTGLDEFLSPVLDILPIQFFADVLALRMNIPFGFRYISKVVRQL
jgi:glutamine---fructose-6-phosphate transaminase (isomerizing)